MHMTRRDSFVVVACKRYQQKYPRLASLTGQSRALIVVHKNGAKIPHNIYYEENGSFL